jgi:RNA polymerase sigma factor for flagellar operon FliA
MNAAPAAPVLCNLLDVLDVVDAALAGLDRRLPLHISREDLASAGRAALVAAFGQMAGPLHEVRAYCFARVRGAMFDELRRLDPLSRRTRARVTEVRRAAAELEQALGRSPTDDELATFTGLAPTALRQAQRLGIAADAHETDGEALAALADQAAVCPARLAESLDLVENVQAALDRLPPRHAHVVRRYHLEEATLEEIAAELGVSIERVRQLRAAGEKLLREDLAVLA